VASSGDETLGSGSEGISCGFFSAIAAE